jgi:biotin carboxylase
MRRHVFVVGCGFPQLGLIRAARKLGYEITGADMNSRAIGVREADHFALASTGDVAAIMSTFRKSRATAIATSGSELALTTTAAAADKLGLPFYADPETVYRCQAKDAMRASYRAAGLEVPFFEHCQKLGDARAFADRVGYPIVAKPAHGWGQRGVSRVESEADLVDAFDLATRASHGGGGAVLEACIMGHEVSVNGWVENGSLVAYCVTDREVFPGHRPLGVMRSEISPSVLEPAMVEMAVEASRHGARALGLLRGPCYSQVAVSSQRAVLFETAARLGGGFDADVTALASGVNLYERLLGVAFDDRSLEHGRTRHALRPAMVRFLKPSPGRVLAVEGVRACRAMPGVVDVIVYPRIGDSLSALLDAAKRIGHILVQGDTREQMIATADEAERTIRIVVDNDTRNTS